MVEKIFFQSSMPRSLSTLFQNCVGQRPDFYVTPTSGTLELLYGAQINFSSCNEFKSQDQELMKNAWAGFCKGGLENYFNAITDKKYVLEKSRGWIKYRGFLNTFYPDPKIICLVRDLKDVVSSFEKIHRKNEHLHKPIDNDSTGAGTTVHKRVDYYMDTKSPTGMAVERIFEVIRKGYDNKILFVKAEDLSLYPDNEMTRVYEYLGIPDFKHDWENIPQITSEDDSYYGLTPDLHTIRPKLEMKPSDAKEILGADICDWLYKNYRWFYDKFGYKK